MNLRHVFETPKEAADACAREILQRLGEAIVMRGRATLAVSGGSTPRLMFDAMTKMEFDWKSLHLFWVDERTVPPNHKDSNFGMTEQALLSHVTPGSVHRICGELAPEDAATAYRKELEEFFGPTPQFDVIHLGMGADAHTASLFPGLSAIDDRTGTVAAVWVEKLSTYRITLLPKVLLEAQQVAMLVTGADKAAPLAQVFDTDYVPRTLPVQLVQRNARVVDWFLDRAAVT